MHYILYILIFLFIYVFLDYHAYLLLFSDPYGLFIKVFSPYITK